MAAGIAGHQRAAGRHRRPRHPRHRVRRTARREATRPRLRRHARQARADDHARRAINMPFLMLVAVAAAFMGMLNALRRFFIPATSPAMYNVVFILHGRASCRCSRRWASSRSWRCRSGMLLGGVAQIAGAVAGAAARGLPPQWIARSARSGAARSARPDGPGHARRRGRADQSARQHVARAPTVDGARGGAAVRVPADVHADRHLRRVGGDGGDPDLARQAAEAALTPRCARRSRGRIRLMLMLSVPATVGLMVLARPIVELIFERGAFDAAVHGDDGRRARSSTRPASSAIRSSRSPRRASTRCRTRARRSSSASSRIAVNLVLNLWLNSVMVSAAWRSARRSRPTSTPACCSCFLSRRIGGIELGARSCDTLRQDRCRQRA